jgi:hypothetical protein
MSVQKKTRTIETTVKKKKVEYYTTSDGEEFPTYAEAADHQETLDYEFIKVDKYVECDWFNGNMTVAQIKEFLSKYEDDDIVCTDVESDGYDLYETNIVIKRKRK